MAKGTEYKIKGRYMQAHFKRVCKVMGWNCEGETVGFTWIQRAPTQVPLYRVTQIVNDSGGEKNLSSNYTSAELAAWFDGILAAHETLVNLHSNIAMAVDSLRGNERFIATAIRNSL